MAKSRASTTADKKPGPKRASPAEQRGPASKRPSARPVAREQSPPAGQGRPVTIKPSKAEKSEARTEAKAVRSATESRAPRAEESKASRKAPGQAAAAGKGGSKQKGVSREQALATIRAALEAKKQRARQAPPWPGADPHQHRANEPTAEAESEADDQTDKQQRSQRDRHETRGVR
jgi:hypothetical protein